MDIEEKVEKPMSDDDIKKYLPDAKILTTQDLNKYNNIEEIFKKNKYVDYVIILFQNEKNSGHWCALMKYGNYYEFFDSYGNSPEKVYKFTSPSMRKSLNINNNKLCSLFDKTKKKVLYNAIKYQKNGNNQQEINTCGRHCCYRILSLLGKGYTLPEYNDNMIKSKKQFKDKSYDEIVSYLINQ